MATITDPATGKVYNSVGSNVTTPATPQNPTPTTANAPAVITSGVAKDNLATINNNVATLNTGMATQSANKANVAIANTAAQQQAAQNNQPAAQKVADNTLATSQETNKLLEELKTTLGKPNTYNYQVGTATARPPAEVDKELQAAYLRVQTGAGTQTDVNNLEYAAKNGWTLPTPNGGETNAGQVNAGTTNNDVNANQGVINADGNAVEKTGGETAPSDTSDLTKFDANGNPLYDASGNLTLYGINQQLDQANSDYKAKMDEFTNGTFPLSTDEQAQVDAMRASFDNMIAEQKTANANYEGATTKLGIVSGRERYAGEEQLGIAKTAVDQGIKKVSDLQAQALSSISNLKQALLDKDYNKVTALYNETTDYLSKKKDIITETNNQVRQAQKDASDAITTQLQQQKLIQELTTAQAPDVKEVNGVFYTYDASTGTMQPIGGQAASAAPIKLTAGETLYDPTTGQALFTAPATPPDYSKPFDVKMPDGTTVSVQRDPITGKNQLVQVEGMDNTQTAQTGLAPGTTGSPQIDTTKQGYTTQTVAGDLTQAAIDKAAIQYATTGTMPSVGLGSTGAAKQKRDAIMARAAELDTNGTISANKSKIASLNASLNPQQVYLDLMTRSINTVDQNLEILNSLAAKVNYSDSPLQNELTNKANANIFGSGDLAAFKSAIQTVRTEYSNILARGGQVSDAVRKEAEQLIPDNIKSSQLQQVLDVLHTEGQNVKDQAQKQVDDIQGQINNIIGGGDLYTQGSLMKPGEVKDNNDGSYTQRLNDGSVRTGTVGDNFQDYTNMTPDQKITKFGGLSPDNNKAVLGLTSLFADEIKSGKITQQDIWDKITQAYGISGGGGESPQVIEKISEKPDGSAGGQCGSFVNKNTGLGLGDSYGSKMAKMDSSIKQPEPGMVFVMPYKDTGHTGFILSINPDGTATVKDSNWGLDEKVQTHKIALSKMTGFARV